MSAEPFVDFRDHHQTDRLANAAAQLEAVLETVDVENEPALAEAVVEAVKTTERASHLAAGRRVS